MLFQIKTINGQKTIVPLTADTGTGNPVGTIIPMYKKSSPSGYLYCDGSTFDETAYPALYQYLGSNVLPDYREFALVGAEENTTDVYNASTNPNGTIHTHDVYTEGQAKDDQVQDHDHNINPNPNLALMAGKQGALGNTDANIGTVYHKNTGNISTGRAGTVTRGKRKAVYFYIKATSGLTENQQENVLNTINENLSYSTTEHKTGKKWYDGKDIYECTFICTTSGDILSNVWTDLTTLFAGTAQVQIDSIIDYKFNIVKNYSAKDVSRLLIGDTTINQGRLSAYINVALLNPVSFAQGYSTLTLEYTKTTDV